MTRTKELQQEIKYLKAKIRKDKLDYKFFKEAAEHAIWNCKRGCSGQQANEADSLAKKAANLYDEIKRATGELTLAESHLARFTKKG